MPKPRRRRRARRSTATASSAPAVHQDDDDASEIALQCLQQYYSFVSKCPDQLHRLYNSASTLDHGTQGETAKPCYGRQEIKRKIDSIGFQDCKVLIQSVDGQKSSNGGVIVQIIGEMSNRREPWQKFVQSVFLAERSDGYTILNDIFRFLRESDWVPQHAFDQVIEPPIILYPTRAKTSRQRIHAAPPDESLSLADQKPSCSPSEVAWQIIPQYYRLVHNRPDLLHCFFGDDTAFTRGLEGEDVKPCYGQQEIREKISSLDLQRARMIFDTMNAQSSAGGVIIQLIGRFSNHYEPWRRFVQTFFLPECQSYGFYILNDVFRFLQEDIVDRSDEETADEDLESALAAEPDDLQVPPLEHEMQHKTHRLPLDVSAALHLYWWS